MKYPEAHKLFKESWTVPYGWHYCAVHKDIESNTEPCRAAITNGQARPLGAMKWQTSDTAWLQCLLEDAVNRLELHPFGKVSTSPADKQPPSHELASSAAIG